MIFRSDKHAEQWAEAIDRAGAVNQDDTVSAYFGASIYILTGIPFLYDRVKKHIHRDYIDFEAVLNSGISSGERILVALAGNLYNGGFFDNYTPWDIVCNLDAGMVELAATAIWLRKRRIDINTIYDLKLSENSRNND